MDISDLQKCRKCGFCQDVCPIYTELNFEPAGARGRLHLIKEVLQGNISSLSNQFEKYIYLCLDCKACATNCPAGIKINEHILSARELIVKSKGINLIKKIILQWLLFSPDNLEKPVSLLWLTQKLKLNSLSKIIFGKKVSLLPEIPLKPLRQQLPDVLSAKVKQKYRVGYFLGCANNLLFQSISLASLKVLTQLGCEVVILKSCKCCGVPHLAYGDKNTYEKLKEHNLKVFKSAGDLDAIITDCTSCSSALKEIKSNVYEINQFIWEVAKNDIDIVKPIKDSITYHDPCHAVRVQGIKEAPRFVLRDLLNMNFIEMQDADVCCGMAGSFVIENYNLSMNILSKKIKNIQNTNANIVATSCPSCRIQLIHGISNAKLNLKVLHPMELLATSISK